jgi:hypothetical protein
VPYAVTSNFNDPRDYGLHEGQDFDIIGGGANSIEPILCAFPGVVTRSVNQGAYGNYVIIQSIWNGTLFNIWYCHMDDRYVSVGQQIEMGWAVGELGATGGPWGEHIHINVQVPGHGLSGYVVPDVVDPDPYTTTEIPVQVNGLLGLHATADPDMEAGEVDTFVTARAEVIKVLSNITYSDLVFLTASLPDVPVIVRAFLSFGGREISPQQFFNDTINDVIRTLSALSNREVWIELHNEPNLVQEGLGTSWPNGTEFGPWLMQVIDLYRQEFPSTKLLFPGLSPGGTITGVRQASTVFIEQARSGVEACDGLGVHVYWAYNYSMQLALDVLDDYVDRFPHKPIWITEASNNKPATKILKATQYISFANELQSRPTVNGVTYFIASAQDPVWGWGNGGSGEIWVGTSIPTIVGQR